MINPAQPIQFPPGSSPWLGVMNLLAFRRDPIGFVQHLQQRYGDLAHFRLGPQDLVLLNDLDLIRDVLVTHHALFIKGRGLEMAKALLGEGLLTSEGEFHRRQRKLIQPAFHQKRIQHYGTVMIDHALRYRDKLQDGECFDMATGMMALTLAIVGRTLFDVDLESESQGVYQAFSMALTLFKEMTNPLAYFRLNLAVEKSRRLHESRQFLDGIILKLIRERRADPNLSERQDLLSMLLQAVDEEGDGTGMTDQQVRDEAMTLFLAGHETTANALAWTWFLLARHPEVEQAFHAELDEVLGGRPPTVEDVPHLGLTRQILTESLRLYPPAWIMGRRPLAPYALGPYCVPAGTVLLISPYLLHHDPRYYPEAESFRPGRWQDDFKKQLPRMAYLPFGSGPRVCIGEHFAWMEGILLLAVLGQAWRFKLRLGHPVVKQPMITLRPRHGMQMYALKR